MKMKSKPAVFAKDKVAVDMLALTLQAMMVGTVAALLAALVVAGFVAWVA